METPAIVNNVRDFFVVEVPKKWNGLSPLNQKVVMAVAALFVVLGAVAVACTRKSKGTRPFTPAKPTAQSAVELPKELADLCRLVRQGDKVAKKNLESLISLGEIKDPAQLKAAKEALANFEKEKLGAF